MAVDRSDASMNELVSMLWSERRVLEQLLFKLVVARLMLSRGNPHHVSIAVAEVGKVGKALARSETERIKAMTEVAESMDEAPNDLTLAWLALHGPTRLRSEFADQREAFTDLIGEIQAMSALNHQLAVIGLEGIQSTLELDVPVTYDAAGRQDRSAAVSGRVERVF